MITLDDVFAARHLLKEKIHRTPVMGSSYFSQRLGVNWYGKMEMFQKAGSFKIRGVLNNVHHLSEAEKQKGVITLSAGNHAQATALAAREMGVTCVVVMPANAVRSKVEATIGYGGEVIQTAGNLLDTCLQIQKARGLTLIHPFDHLMTIAGHATVGLEILEDIPQADVVICGVGGGGLISGVAGYLKQAKPNIRVYGVEPEGAPTMTQSLMLGKPVYLDKPNTVADGLAAPFVGKHNLEHVQQFVDEIVIVNDAEIGNAMRLTLERCKVLAEPAAAASVAALLSNKVPLNEGETVVCILSGGNVDLEKLKMLL
jgi:threonine dehydratase